MNTGKETIFIYDIEKIDKEKIIILKIQIENQNFIWFTYFKKLN